LLVAGHFPSSSAASGASESALVFNTTVPKNDLRGDFEAQVLFAQSQIIPARPREDDRQPRLISLRKSLLMVRPLRADTAAISATALDASGKELGTLKLNPPAMLPKTAYFMEGLPAGGLDFTPKGSSLGLIDDSAGIAKLAEKDGGTLRTMLGKNALVEVATADGRWVKDIYLPAAKAVDGKIVRINAGAGYGSTVHYGDSQVSVSRGQSVVFKASAGRWFREGELDNNGLRYASDAWSADLPAEWIRPGLVLRFTQGKAAGELAALDIGAPTQLLLHTIDLGFLTTPRGAFGFAKDPEAHREYFQTAPVSRLIVSQYAPLHLKEVMLPTGVLLKEVDPSKGGWHEGAMRQHIGKELVSHGIDNANYGLHSTAGAGEKGHPYAVAQLTAHNSRGVYSNGVQVHGGSGGNGMVTLDNSLGNEFSHEVGHNYGLGHYVDGFKGSVHRPADQINSTWGWDADKRRFLPNFSPLRTGKDATLEGQSQPPFDGRSYGFDAMAGGAPFSSFNRFTLYTPNTAAIIQKFLESKAVFDPLSPTGFSKWNESAAKMEPFSHRLAAGRAVVAPVKGLSEASLAKLLAEYERVSVAMGDGNWTKEIPLPKASAANKGRSVSIAHEAGYNSVLLLNGEEVTVSRGFAKAYVSDGKKWQEGTGNEGSVERKPQTFGAPVVTLLGYYDPAATLTSYAYPALHGSLGFCYADESTQVKPMDCQLVVETKAGILRFRLADRRIDAKHMNKFHVNVPAASQPTQFAVMVGGKVVAKRTIEPTTEKLAVTVHGYVPPAK
ncbi:MAG: hypothetical protein RL639_1623, partial [Verrucomicrobiota bacterium]